jgi:hypothetical protein
VSLLEGRLDLGFENLVIRRAQGAPGILTQGRHKVLTGRFVVIGTGKRIVCALTVLHDRRSYSWFEPMVDPGHANSKIASVRAGSKRDCSIGY